MQDTPATTAASDAAAKAATLPDQLAEAGHKLAESAQKGDFSSVWHQLLDMAVQFTPRLLQLVLVVILAWVVAGWLKRVVVGASTRAHIEITLAKFFGNIARWLVLLIAGIMVLGIFGVQTASLAAALAAIGFAIGLALQGTLSNIASGIMLLILRPFRVGDVILVNGLNGRVEEVELFHTSLDTLDNRRITIPNSTIFGAVIENYTRHGTRRVDFSIGTAYAADLDATRKTLLEAARSIPSRDPAQDPQVALLDFSPASVSWGIRIWCPTDAYFDVRDAALRACKLALDKAGMAIPPPLTNVNIQRWPGPPPAG